MSRRKAREFAFKVLFQVDQGSTDPQQAFNYLLEENHLLEKDRIFAWELINGYFSHSQEIDDSITKHSTHWPLDRISAIDRSIMRVAGYEILYVKPSYSIVAIDEAIEIAKKYGDETSSSFINAILDKFLGDQE